MRRNNDGGVANVSSTTEKRRYDLPVAATLRLQSRSGRITVIAEPRDDVEAETDALEAFKEERLKPCDALMQMAREEARFYDHESRDLVHAR